MSSPVDRFLEHLDCIFQVEPEFLKMDAEDGGPPVGCIVYRDIPERGSITGITFGLSYVPHTDWVTGRNELIISVDSEDVSWPLAMAKVAAQLRGRCPFCYGDVINFRAPIADESQMSAFVTFAPAILEREDFIGIDLGDYNVNLAGLYPIYDEERDVIDTVGLEAFWKHPNFELYDVNRAVVRG